MEGLNNRDFGLVTKRLDGTFEIIENGYPFHVTKDDPRYPLVYFYVDKHPNMVVMEQIKGEISIEQLRELKKAEVALDRWKQEVSGVVIQGMLIATDERSQGLLNGAALRAFIDPRKGVNWKVNGTFIPLSANQIMGIA